MMKLQIKQTVLIACVFIAVLSCTRKDEISNDELSSHQKEFYTVHYSFLSQFDKQMIFDWIRQIEFDENTGEMVDSKALILEGKISESQFDQLLVELYASEDTCRIIVHNDEDIKAAKIIINTKINSSYKTDDDEYSGKETHVWYNKKNVALGGCTWSWKSICAIKDDVVIIHP